MTLFVTGAGCWGDPVGVQISGPPAPNTSEARVFLRPTNGTEDNVTYVVTIANPDGTQRGSYQVVWKKGEARNIKSASFKLTAEEHKLYTGPGPDGMGQDITSKFTIATKKR